MVDQTHRRVLEGDDPPVRTGNRQTRRWLIGSAAAASGVVALAACGQATSEAPKGGTTGTGPKGTVHFWQWGVVYNDGFETLIKDFQAKANGITIEFTPAASGVNYWDKLTAAMAGDVGPDVFLMNTNARTWATKGLMRPLDDLIKKDKAADQANQAIIKSFRDWYDVNGKQTGWGWDYSTIVTAFNVAHLKEAGLKLPSELGDKWDWNTFREYAQKLNRPAANRWGVHANPGYEAGWLNFVRANGGDYFSDDRKKCILGSAQVIEAIEFVSGLVTRDKVSPTRAEVSAVTGTQVQMFINGQISIGTFGDWSMVDFIKKGGSGLDWDAAPIPFKNGKTGSSANFRGMVINPQTKVLEASFEWLKFALSKPVQDRVPLLFNEVPARLDSAQEVYLNPEKAGPPKGRTSLKPSLLATKALPALDKVPPAEFHNISNPLINDVWDAKISAKEAMTKAQEQINVLIQQAGT
ncbi:MAG: sugar ABC transporter substrate-binding protein [Chloroflexi bacterium]|nr:sugar ABC transporter substrate-binding protein [Chloroflexota bacterium]